MCCHLSEKIKIELLFKEVRNYVLKKYISYNVNLLYENDYPKTYSNLSYEYLFYYDSFLETHC